MVRTSKNLQWAPDGNSLFYISGKCIQSVTFPEGVVTTDYLLQLRRLRGSFRDFTGWQAGCHQRQPCPVYCAFGCNCHIWCSQAWVNWRSCRVVIFKYPDLTKQQSIKQVRWLKTGKRIAVDALTPNASGQIIDNILIYDLTSCTAPRPATAPHISRPRLSDIFPGEPF